MKLTEYNKRHMGYKYTRQKKVNRPKPSDLKGQAFRDWFDKGMPDKL